MDQMCEFYGKRIDRLFKEPGQPVIVVFREKHNDDRSVCLNRDELERLCLTKLWRRHHAGYFNVCPKPAPPPIPKGEIDAMPDGATKRGAVEEWAHYDRECGRHEDSTEQMKMVKAALSDRDGTLAFAVLQNRSDGEYEGFDVEPGGKIAGPPSGDLLDVKPGG